MTFHEPAGAEDAEVYWLSLLAIIFQFSCRNFELHAIFWTLYRSHPAIVRVGHAAASAAAAAMGLQWARVSHAEGGGANAGMDCAHGDMPGSMSESGGLTCSSDANAGKQNMDGAVRAAAQVFEGHHQLNYPCNSVARDVVVFMEARKPVLCNNQKKIFMLRGNLHHDTSLFQNRAWLQIPASKTWESCKYVGGGGIDDRGDWKPCSGVRHPLPLITDRSRHCRVVLFHPPGSPILPPFKMSSGAEEGKL